jgi:hypothetical protein
MSLALEDSESRGSARSGSQRGTYQQTSRLFLPEDKSPPRNEKIAMPVIAPPSNRKWDKLRSTLEAQENRSTAADEDQMEKSRKSKILRLPKIGKRPIMSDDPLREIKSMDEGDAIIKRSEPRKTVVFVSRAVSTDEGDATWSGTKFLRNIGGLYKAKSHDGGEDFHSGLGSVPATDSPDDLPQIVDGPSDVRICVEDLSKAHFMQPDTDYDNSLDATFTSRDTDPESSIEESMEVLYIGEQKSWLGGKGVFKTEIQG